MSLNGGNGTNSRKKKSGTGQKTLNVRLKGLPKTSRADARAKEKALSPTFRPKENKGSDF